MAITIDLEQDHIECLELLAKENGRKINDYITEAIDRYIEDIEDLKLAEKMSADIKSGRTKTIPHEEVKKMYGL